VRPDRDSTRNIGSDGAKPGKKLQDIPKTKKDDGRNRQREDKNQGKDPRPWVQQHVSTHNAGDGAACANGRDIGMQIEEHMQQASPNSAKEIKEGIRDVSEEILDIVAEDPEEQHVPREVPEIGMEKHAGDEGQERDFETNMAGQKGRETGWHGGVRQQQGFKCPVGKCGFEARYVKKHYDVRKEEGDVDEWIGAGGVEVLERDEHGMRSAAE